ncbi:MAG: class I SAM-dependent methyltransferase [Pseudomonadota bacterium]
MKNKSGKTKGSGKKGRLTMADQADRHLLYQEAVQCVEAEIDFVDETYEEIRGKRAKWLREDFCGTANTSCEWIRRRATNHAVGVDLDADVLAWGRKNNIGALKSGKDRIELLEENVMSVSAEKMDIVLAMNFSYWILRERAQLIAYFSSVREALNDDGIFFLDAYGGYDAYKETKDRNKFDGFTYIWDQAEYHPVTGYMRCHIHFRFPDGSRINRAFSYEWRLWSLPEIQELLTEAGFSNIVIYWQGADEETGEGDGEFEPETQGEADPAWIVYIVAEK